MTDTITTTLPNIAHTPITTPPTTQLQRALERIKNEANTTDPNAAVAAFNSGL